MSCAPCCTESLLCAVLNSEYTTIAFICAVLIESQF